MSGFEAEPICTDPLAPHIRVRLMLPPHRIPSIWNLPLPCDPLSCALMSTVLAGLFRYRLNRTSPRMDTVPRSPPGATTTPFVIVQCLTYDCPGVPQCSPSVVTTRHPPS